MNADRFASIPDLEQYRERLLRHWDKDKPTITLCSGTGCLACGCAAVNVAFQEALKSSHLSNDVLLRRTGCHGFCERGPLVVINPDGIFYQRVKPADAKLIVDQTIKAGKLVNRLLYRDPLTKETIVKEKDIPFYKKQRRLIFAKNGFIDPTSFEDYLIHGGYRPLAKALKMTPPVIIAEMDRSGLRGRGGAGFPTGKKWAACRKSESFPKYLVCNADEGDPGAFMDRSLLEGNPHSVIEGMVIGAHAMGCSNGFVYVRNEYPLAVKNLTVALHSAREYGLLGKNILGTGMNFDIEIVRGAGAFVCGEETALMKSIEGYIGEPLQRPPYPVERGIWGKPTCINNVESWANIPIIIEMGASGYASIGTAGSKGTKVFSLTGKVNNTGLVEVPMGITLREILYDIGGGVRGNKRFKAVQTGGPSGGTLIVETSEPNIHDSLVAHGDIREDEQIISLLDLPVDFDELSKAGSMMGSGGMIVMDEDSCMVDMAKYFLTFLQEESCGKCLPCREGIRTMLDILTRISRGQGVMDDIALLEELGQVLIDTSLCALGGTAPNPILSTLKYFRQEYLAHIRDKWCPAGVCKELVSHAITEKCTGCVACLKPCPTNAIIGKPKELHSIIQDKCVQCGACYQVCKYDAIVRVQRGKGLEIQRRAIQTWQPSVKREAATVA